ncbi:MAG: phenylpyruvate tautomerase MIF-related protein [Thomasclavelia sp.]|nr:phenylpyruvate tautomerase MIF-related protein [Thomasclavelia sp.]
MPFITFSTNHKLTLKQEVTIKKETGKLISIIPSKSEKALMIHMEDNQIMYYGGSEEPCMMINVAMFHHPEFENKKKFTEELIKMINQTTNISIDNIYLKFEEYDSWGKGGTLTK